MCLDLQNRPISSQCNNGECHSGQQIENQVYLADMSDRQHICKHMLPNVTNDPATVVAFNGNIDVFLSCDSLKDWHIGPEYFGRE